MAPLSGKQRKAQLKLKRAIKRGDAPPQPEQLRKRPPQTSDAVNSARKLQSQFVKLDKTFLDDTRALAGSIVLRRPIPNHVAVLRHEPSAPGTQLPLLALPKRPKWRYQMSKDELDANEQAHFRTWLAQQDAIVEQWQLALNAPLSTEDPPADLAGDHVDDSETRPMPHPPTHFERNIEVWRQFWRVTEISQILLVLLDSRCPPLHLPSSLSAYLNIPTSSSPQNNPSPRSKQSSKSKAPRIILVLTKVDISGPARTASWTSFLNASYPDIPVVPVEAYAPKSSLTLEQGPTRYEPRLPGTFRERLVHTLRDVHDQLLQPPQWVTAPRPGESEEERLQRAAQWRPRVKRVIDWDGVLKAKGNLVGKAVGGAAMPKGQDVEHETEGDEGDDVKVSDSEEEKMGDTYEWKEPEYLTVGVIGQPNVGKSSLLNAIFGKTRVRASRTPGKTKHFQTLFWTPDVRLVDCPGLVMPSFIPMDIQVLSGVLPISRISAVPFCIHQLARLLPLEQILGLTHPSLSLSPAFAASASNATATVASTSGRGSVPQSSKSTSTAKSNSKPAPTDATLVEDKRTWRPGQRSLEQTKAPSSAARWTANDIMIAYAEKKGWVTAKAGRPDIHRAGNAILRFVAEGKIPWGFWPPGSLVSGDDGIWLKDGVQQHAWDVLEMDEDRDEEEGSEEQDSEMEELSSEEEDTKARIDVASDDEDEDDEKPAVRGGNLGRFGALGIE
ncbi:P-loop containing nucleoside triphosphate hydrolase protein [Imleria badia]|nr:P-loop containing nucleoside triphosphate hydrolase protein [Imleria badia]